MRARAPIFLLAATLSIITACSSPPPPRDQRPLGVVTASPGECGLISSQAISRATGLDDFYASGTRTVSHFSHCIVSKSADMQEPVRLSFELHDPLQFSLEGLERRRVADKGTVLPAEIGPGYSALLRREDGEPAGAYVSAWTADGTKMLSIRLYLGASGRDHRADVIEFARQLRPILLTSRS